MRHLSVLEGGRSSGVSGSYVLHPVHGTRAERQARKVLEAHFATDGEPPRLAQLSVSLLFEAVKRNDRGEPGARDALEALGAFFSMPADDCPVHGMERLFPPEDIA